MPSSCITKMDKEKYEKSGYVSFRVRDPSLFKGDAIRIPEWGRKVADSVSKGSYVVQGQLKGSSEWRVQSIRLKAGNKSDETLRSEARSIAQKLCACEDTEYEIERCRHENYLKRKNRGK